VAGRPVGEAAAIILDEVMLLARAGEKLQIQNILWL
jgi:hypothetical protein